MSKGNGRPVRSGTRRPFVWGGAGRRRRRKLQLIPWL